MADQAVRPWDMDDHSRGPALIYVAGRVPEPQTRAGLPEGSP